MTIVWKNAAILFGIIFISGALIGNALYMNPLVAGIYEKAAAHPGIKSWKEFGSTRNFVALNMLAGFFINLLYVALFSIMRSRLPDSWIAAGMFFSVLIILVKAAPEAWNQFLNINYPTKLVLTQLVNSAIGIMATGIILSFAWTRWPALE